MKSGNPKKAPKVPIPPKGKPFKYFKVHGKGKKKI